VGLRLRSKEMKVRPFREPARLLFHLGGGYSRVLLTRFDGMGITDGSVGIDIPTTAIPPALRGLGSRFVVVGQYITPEDHDTADDLRAALRAVHVEELH
jgi:hypothetical protein